MVFNLIHDVNHTKYKKSKFIDFAAKRHRNQRRLDPHQTPFFNRPIGKSFEHYAKNELENLLDIQFYKNVYISTEVNVVDLNILTSAILHYTIECNDTTFDNTEFFFKEKFVATLF